MIDKMNSQSLKGMNDNKWFWIVVKDGQTAEDVKKLLKIKFDKVKV